jgi:hypothetical protein
MISPCCLFFFVFSLIFFVSCAVHVVSKESRRSVLPGTSVFIIKFIKERHIILLKI